MAPFSLSRIRSNLRMKNESKLIRMIMKRKWPDILDLLVEQGTAALEDKGTASVHLTYDSHKQGNVLHIMCEYHPPAKVVNHIASMFPLLTIQVNKDKQTPLHVAAAHGASHRVISTLLKHGGSSPATMQDIKGRTPLHLHLKHCTADVRNCDPGDNDFLCTKRSSSSNNKGDSSASACVLVSGPNVKILRLLAEAAPQSIQLEDKEGQTPLCLATPAKLESRFVSALVKTSEGFRAQEQIKTSSPRNLLVHTHSREKIDSSATGTGPSGSLSEMHIQPSDSSSCATKHKPFIVSTI